MELFLAGILTEVHAARERHLHQAKAIQAAISNRWHRDNPWTWQQKHLDWFLKSAPETAHGVDALLLSADHPSARSSFRKNLAVQRLGEDQQSADPVEKVGFSDRLNAGTTTIGEPALPTFTAPQWIKRTRT